jgi:hypothetical protein
MIKWIKVTGLNTTFHGTDIMLINIFKVYTVSQNPDNMQTICIDYCPYRKDREVTLRFDSIEFASKAFCDIHNAVLDIK